MGNKKENVNLIVTGEEKSCCAKCDRAEKKYEEMAVNNKQLNKMIEYLEIMVKYFETAMGLQCFK